MGRVNKLFEYKLFLVICFVFVIGVTPLFAANMITGTVSDRARNPLPDIDIELLDEYYRSIPGQRQRTSSAGRFEFAVSNDGRYYIKVYGFKYDYVDELREVVLQSISAVPGAGGNSYNVEDFTLQPKKGGLADAELAVVFAQNVPKDAKDLYETALGQFSKKKSQEGIMTLVKAVEKFPEYYLALQRLTRELFALQKPVESFQYARRVVAVNPKSANGYYYMGASLRTLGKDYAKASAAAFAEAARLAPGSSQVLFALGKVERDLGDFVAAEKHLLSAKKLSATKNADIQAELSQLYANDLKKYGEAADELEDYLKAGKFSDVEEKAIRDKIADLRQKSNTKTGN